jgi:hypothetical protein
MENRARPLSNQTWSSPKQPAMAHPYQTLGCRLSNGRFSRLELHLLVDRKHMSSCPVRSSSRLQYPPVGEDGQVQASLIHSEDAATSLALFQNWYEYLCTSYAVVHSIWPSAPRPRDALSLSLQEGAYQLSLRCTSKPRMKAPSM